MSDVQYFDEAEIVVDFGKNNFVIIARKVAKVGQNEHEFISLSRGYYTRDGQRKFVKSMSLPLEIGKRRELAKAIVDIY